MTRLYVGAIAVGAILTPIAHKIATARRGYSTIGGEALIILLLILGVLALKEGTQMIAEIKEIFTKEEEERSWT